MPENKQVERRQFLQLGSAALWGASFFRCGNPDNAQYRFFTDEEAALVIELTDQIIPADEYPGAKWAGVIHYIDRQLVGPFTRNQSNYRDSLPNIDRACRELHGSSFLELEWNARTTFLETVDSGNAPKTAVSPAELRSFFNLVRGHTMQGFYGGPQHGGNKDFTSWRMMGLPYPQVRGQNRYGENPAAKI
jgi:gluconate 2-dehydrogenase gamma chain